MKFSRIEKALIKKAIKESETKADVEILPIFLGQSDLYPVAHYRIGILFAIIFAAALYLSPLHFVNPLFYLSILLPGFITGFMLAYIPGLKKLFITRDEINEEVHQRAIELFFEEKMHLTQKNNGVLVVVSLLEKKVEIILDHGLVEKCPKEALDVTIQHFTDNMKANRPYEAMKDCLMDLSNIFEKYFVRENPKKYSDNEISDNVIFKTH